MEGSIIGYKLWFQNPDFGVNVSGSPSEILRGVHGLGVSFSHLLKHPVTDIKIAKLRMVEPPQELSGGTHTEAIMDLLACLVDDTDFGQANRIVESNRDLARSNDNALAVPLLAAIASSKVEAARFLVSKGIGTTQATLYEMTPLHWAAALGEEEIVRLLLESEVEKSPLNTYLLTPVDLAALNERKAAAKVFESKRIPRSKDVSPDLVLDRMKTLSSKAKPL